jgi:G3E family GTPase
MNITTDQKIPICLVTGFLGAGKTTLLKQIVSDNRDKRLVYIVNEFSPHDIDGSIVSKENPNVVSIPGGSIFCKCLVTEFIGQLSTIPAEFEGAEGVIIEASGMANPKVIADMLTETKLDQRYYLAHVVSIVDPGSFLKLCAVLPNITAQIEASNTIIVNKTDLHDTNTVDSTSGAVRKINPKAQIMTAVNADIALNLFNPAAVRTSDLHGDYAKCKDPNYETITLTISQTIAPQELQQRLTQAENDIYRLKGPILTTEGPRFIEYTKSGLTLNQIDDAGDRTIVMILRGSPSQSTRSFIAWLADTQ